MRVHLRETKIGDRRGLERLHHMLATDAARAEFFEQLVGFDNGHHEK